MLASNAEKIVLVETVADRDKQLVQLSEDIVFFKDALAKVPTHSKASIVV